MFGFSTRILINPESPATDSYRSIMRCVYASTPIATGRCPGEGALTPIVGLDIQSTLGIRPDAFGNVVSQSVLRGHRLLPRGRDDTGEILDEARRRRLLIAVASADSVC
jgi:hypothetical protein